MSDKPKDVVSIKLSAEASKELLDNIEEPFDDVRDIIDALMAAYFPAGRMRDFYEDEK